MYKYINLRFIILKLSTENKFYLKFLTWLSIPKSHTNEKEASILIIEISKITFYLRTWNVIK